MLAIVDTGTCNLSSVANALRRVGAETSTVSSAAELEGADAIVLPGVGAFGAAMDSLRARGLIVSLRRRAGAGGTPLLAICLGMQMLAEASEENGTHEGLGLIPGRVVLLQSRDPAFRVPNIGWYRCHPTKDGSLFRRDRDAESFYFVHSYHLACTEPKDVAATIDYGGAAVTAAVERGNIFGCQFHPEKSQDSGLELLRRFVARAARG